jgi:two-component system osmolarity sensor histidine kinase EnvZ
MLRLSLFWRTFWLIIVLLLASLGAALGLARYFEPLPAEQRLAWELSSVINLTRSALISSSGSARASLLASLQNEEQVRVLPTEASDRTRTFAQSRDPRARQAEAVQLRLGEIMQPPPRVFYSVNNIVGLWVTFDIDDDDYWLQFSLDRLDRQINPASGPWLVIALGLAAFGALVLSRTITKPLKQLGVAIEQFDHHADIDLNQGPPELAAIGQKFSALAADLRQMEQDRALSLAGVSHDVRTPLARLRLSLEMAPLSPQERDDMTDDVEQIDHIVGQFVEYGRAASQSTGQTPLFIDADALERLRHAVEISYRAALQDGSLELRWHRLAAAWWGHEIDLRRIIDNLIENALRYGQVPDTNLTRVDVTIECKDDHLVLTVDDSGRGIPAQDRQRLTRPFARAESARTLRASAIGRHTGSGLGLAIVTRLAQRYEGSLRLEDAPIGGLRAVVTLHSLKPPA